MEKTLQILNRLEQEGILSGYAIGGAMAAMFYVEPVSTFVLDIFVILPQQGRPLTLSPLYDALHAKGYVEQGECMMIEGVPVQFLPAYISCWKKRLIKPARHAMNLLGHVY